MRACCSSGALMAAVRCGCGCGWRGGAGVLALALVVVRGRGPRSQAAGQAHVQLRRRQRGRHAVDGVASVAGICSAAQESASGAHTCTIAVQAAAAQRYSIAMPTTWPGLSQPCMVGRSLGMHGKPKQSPAVAHIRSQRITAQRGGDGVCTALTSDEVHPQRVAACKVLIRQPVALLRRAVVRVRHRRRGSRLPHTHSAQHSAAHAHACHNGRRSRAQAEAWRCTLGWRALRRAGMPHQPCVHACMHAGRVANILISPAWCACRSGPGRA